LSDLFRSFDDELPLMAFYMTKIHRTLLLNGVVTKS
jgi:hypothetical protein